MLLSDGYDNDYDTDEITDEVKKKQKVNIYHSLFILLVMDTIMIQI